jgi:hypothetical protein
MAEITQNFDKEVIKKLHDHLKSDGPAGMKIISAFMEEFDKLSERSPKDDPTNIKNHMKFLLNHIKTTWDESLKVNEDGTVEVGVGKDETLGFDLDRRKLKHNPTPVAWVVYLIRGIGGRYAFINEEVYRLKKGKPMPPIYAGGFLISKRAWEKEGWYRIGPFEAYEHPASGAPPIPFFKNILRKIDINSIVSEVLHDLKVEQ